MASKLTEQEALELAEALKETDDHKSLAQTRVVKEMVAGLGDQREPYVLLLSKSWISCVSAVPILWMLLKTIPML